MDIQERISGISKELIEIRQFIHQNPELSGKEYKTTLLIKEYLDRLGIQSEIGPNMVGVIATINGNHSGQTLAIRADIDALPIHENTQLSYKSTFNQVMHACGHDIHTTVLLGTANILQSIRDSLNGTVKLIFQPAEETMSGAAQLIDHGVLTNPNVDAIIALHTWPELPVGKIGFRYGAMMSSSDNFKIIVKGQGGHAAHPQKSVDPILIAGHIITSLQSIVSREISPIESVVLTIGEIHGGNATNIIPNEVVLRGTVRSSNDKIRNELPSMMERIVKNIAEAMRGKVDFSYNYGCPALISDDRLVDIFEKSVIQNLGSENLVQLPQPSMGSEDFAFYLEKVPGMLFRLGTSNESSNSKLPLHNSQIEFDDDSIYYGVNAMVHFAKDYFNAYHNDLILKPLEIEK